MENARRKARAVEAGELVLGADTEVALDGDILGKPRDAAQARAFLERLAGRTHEVVGGIALVRDGEVADRASRSPRSTSAPLDRRDARLVRETGEWEGRAGGYAIQGRGAALVDRDRGRLPERRRAAARALLTACIPTCIRPRPISRGSAEGVR